MTDLPTDGDRSGTRSRAGNNMSRSRAGILSGAAACLERYGPRKTTMADISREGGIAKATLYNHFRDKSEVYAALLEREVDEVLARVRDAMAKAVADAGHDRGSAPLAAALATAAARCRSSGPAGGSWRSRCCWRPGPARDKRPVAAGPRAGDVRSSATPAP
jgi:AcrR family transcriptional regulator